jgi:hypothetical protein
VADITYETDIVFLDDPKKYPYLREITVICGTKRGCPPKPSGQSRIVAYAVLGPDTPSDAPRCFLRRIWTFRDTDPYGPPYPAEAKDPLRLAAKQQSPEATG